MFRNWCLIASISYGVGFGSILLVSRNLSQSALGGLGTLPAVAVSMTVLSRQRRQEIERQVTSVKLRLQELEQWEQSIQQQIQVQLASSEELAQKLPAAQAALAEQSDFLLSNQSKSQTLKQEISGLLQEQRNQQTHLEELTVATSVLRTEQQALEIALSALRQIKIAEQQKNSEISSSIVALEQEREAIRMELERLVQAQSQQQTVWIAAEQAAKEKQQQEQQAELLLTQKVSELAQKQRQQEDLLSQLELEIDQKQATVRATEHYLSQIQEQLQQLSLAQAAPPVSLQPELPADTKVAQLDTVPDLAPTEPKLPELDVHAGSRGLYRRSELVDQPYNFADRTAQSLTNPQYAKKVWEEQVLPHWLDRDKPKGQRFLGNVNISREQSDELMSLIADNLRPLKPSSKNINKKFQNSSQDWIKIFTFALSEYAYYYSDDKFWEGLCNKWMLPYNQGVENTLRSITERGISLLGLIEARDGYRYVSTMWLQSGIPYRNLDQFARLMQELYRDGNWDDLAQDSTENLARRILEIYERRYPFSGTLFRLLNYQPVSGKIVSGIAKIAKELQDGRLELSILANEAKRRDILSEISLNNGFFLRDWEAVIKILEPKSTDKKQCIQKKLAEVFLHLDTECSENIQLVLPTQHIWKEQWSNLQGSRCSIPMAQWEGGLDLQEDLQIPELIVDIVHYQPVYSIELVSDCGDVINTWSCLGADEALPCLIFDAFSGEHLPIEYDRLVTRSTEIICFVPATIEATVKNDGCLLESGIPSSIKGWRGSRLQLKGRQAVISLCSENGVAGSSIQWQSSVSNKPRLTGLGLDTKPNYFETPMLWLPPDSNFSKGEVKVSTAEHNEEVHTESFSQRIINGSKWRSISLAQTNLAPGKYRVDVSNESLPWSDEFTVSSQYEVTTSIMKSPEIYIDDRAIKIESLPLLCATSYEFNAKIIEIKGLWTLESVELVFVSEIERFNYLTVQANQHGSLEVRLSELSEFWNKSADLYVLSYRRRGEELVELLARNRL